jgi:hypothetical protein
MSKKSFTDTLVDGFGDAIADIRHKVVEEPMYGRETTKDVSPYANDGLPATFEEHVKQNEVAPPEQAQEQDLER